MKLLAEKTKWLHLQNNSKMLTIICCEVGICTSAYSFISVCPLQSASASIGLHLFSISYREFTSAMYSDGTQPRLVPLSTSHQPGNDR